MPTETLHNQTGWVAGLAIMLLISACTKTEPLFQRLEASETGITFSNDIPENDTLNIINYANIYNGGGVGIADFNNDGLQDIYFTGLTVDNKLYLNRGGFQFDDVTDEANAAAAGRWSSGVAVVDINSDGLMDIYVCVSSNKESEEGASLLYINQGVNEDKVPLFKDMAEEYHVAFTEHATMAAFFDYDNDSDLDLYLMVNQFNRNSSMNRYRNRMRGQNAETRDHLFRNEGSDSLGHPWFTEVSEEAGIVHEGFGLGVNITDINRDGWKDVYVANDFYTEDLLYINNGNGTFTDKSRQVFKHTAYAAMGSDVADINNDGYSDFVVLDMRPEGNYRKKKLVNPNDYSAALMNKRYNYDYYQKNKRSEADYYTGSGSYHDKFQFERNVLQLYQGRHPKTGEPLYSDIGILGGIAETDWSWAPLLVDLDNDGWRDLVVTNGFPKEITDNDFEEYFEFYPRYLSLEDLLERLPSQKISNYLYRNRGDSTWNAHSISFEDVTERWGMKIPSFSYGTAQVDLNNDGALDLVVNNIDEPAFIFRNRLAELYPKKNNYLRIRLRGTGDNAMGLGTFLEIEYGDGKKQFHEYTLYRGYESSVEPVVHFGLGDRTTVDKLTVTWPDSSVQVIRDLLPNQVLTLHQKDAAKRVAKEPDPPTGERPIFRDATGESGIDYVHEEWDYNDFNVQPLLPHKLSQYGPGVSVGDVNSDGLDDLYLSGAFDYKGRVLIQQEDGTFENADLVERYESENREEEMGTLFFDADGDGDDDLYIVSGSYEHPPGDQAYRDRLFLNEEGILKRSEEALPRFLSSGSAVRASDFDRDGDLDLFVGGRVKPHRYPEPVDSYILMNVSDRGEVRFEIANGEVAPFLNELGMISDALWTDYNNDGWTDLILAGEWMPLTFLTNDGGTFVDETAASGLGETRGWWNSLCGADFDNDGDTDYIAGNLGANTYFQASEEFPVRVYANDFDGNGVFDMIPSVYGKNAAGYRVEVPFHGRETMIQQIPGIKKEFPNYHLYASASMNDLLSRYETSDMQTYRATHLKSSFIENKGSGNFEITPLPDKAQWAPLYGCIAEDLDSDGNPDVMAIGNDYGMELSAGRSDALNGMVLKGDGRGSFEIIDFEESGFFLPGDGKALVSFVNTEQELVVVASQNRGPLKVFKNGTLNKPIPVEPGEAFSMIHFKDGRKQKKEFYHGSGFLSQSERYLIPPDGYLKIEITDFQGNTRTVAAE